MIPEPPIDALTRMVLRKLLEDQNLLRLIRASAGTIVRTIAGSGTVTPAPHTHDAVDLGNTYNLLAGSGITLVADTGADTITIHATGEAGGETWELIAGPGIIITPDTENNTLTISAIGGGTTPTIYTTLTDDDGYELIDSDGSLLVEAY